MSPSSVRPLSVVLLAGAALAFPAASPAASITISASPGYSVLGSPVTVKVTSDTAGVISIRQARTNRRTGSVNCWANRPNFPAVSGSWLGGPALKYVDYTTPGVPVTVRLNGARLEYFGGDPLSVLLGAGSAPGKACIDPPTQYTRIGAWQTAAGVDVAALKPFVRIL